MIINSNAGLWGYNLGDTVKFVSLDPYRMVVSGRTKHFISAFGEHVIGEEVEYALLKAAKEENIKITEFTVAPIYPAGQRQKLP
jgi:non-ribosomal peptide synthetase component E (peptide arylation enzyme)